MAKAYKIREQRRNEITEKRRDFKMILSKNEKKEITIIIIKKEFQFWDLVFIIFFVRFFFVGSRGNEITCDDDQMEIFFSKLH